MIYCEEIICVAPCFEQQKMSLQFSYFSILYLVTAIISALTTHLITRQRAVPGKIPLAWLMIAVAEWSLAAALEAASVEITAKVFWSIIQYAGAVSVPVLFLIFILEYTRLDKQLTHRDLILLWLIPVITLLMAATNDWHGLVWSSLTPSPDDSTILIYGHATWFWIFTAYTYLLIMGGVFYLIWAIIRFPKMFRRQIGILLTGSAVPIVGEVFYLTGLNPVAGLDLTPISFSITGLILALGVFRFQLFKLVPMARDILIESMSDSLLVLDDQNRIVDINPAFQQLIGVSVISAIGQPARDFFAAWPDLVSQYIDTLDTQAEICLSEEPPRYVELHISPLYDQHQRFTGRLIVLHDITERKLTQEALEHKAREMAALFKTSLEINAMPDLSSLLYAIVERTTGLLGTTMGGLYLVRPDGQSLELVISYNLGKDHRGTILRFGEGLSGQVAQTGEAMMIADYSQWDHRAAIYNDISIKRVLAVPLKIKGKVIGVIIITDDRKTGSFTQEDIRLVSLFADKAAIAIENARLLEESNRQATQLGIINRFSLAITSALDMDHVLKTLHEQCQQVAPCDVFYVALYDEASSLIHIPLYYENGQYQAGPSRDIHDHPGTIGAVIQARRTLYLSDSIRMDTRSHKRSTAALRRPTRSYVGIPLTLRDRMIGVMSVQSYQPKAYSEDGIHTLELIALQAAIAFENARLYAEEQRLAIIDELTGVYNYRGLMALGGREVDRARRFDRNLSILFFDVDGFRNFNNKYSHATGNMVLQAIAQQCRAKMRSVDLISRFGGDEFVILLPEANLETTKKAAERLQMGIASTKVPTKYGDLSVTISIGVVQLSAATPDLGALIERANQAEHRAKEKGNGRLVVFGDK